MTNFYFLIVNYNSSNLIQRLLNSIRLRDCDRVIIVNNSLEDRQITELENKQIIIIKAKTNLGFGKACNLGLNWIGDRDRNALVWLINPDTYFDEIEDKAIARIATEFLQKYPEISILGTTVYDFQGQLTAAGGTFTPGTGALSISDRLPEDLQQEYYQTDWVSGCSLLLNLANFAELPQFDPRYFLYYEDLDFCLRYSQKGHQIAVTDSIRVKHDTSSITSRNILQKYRHITRSYLIHMEKHANKKVFILTNLRMMLNTIRLLVLKPQQGMGKARGIYEYWQGTR